MRLRARPVQRSARARATLYPRPLPASSDRPAAAGATLSAMKGSPAPLSRRCLAAPPPVYALSPEVPMHISRRVMLTGGLALAAGLIPRAAAAAKPTVTVYKSPTCGCCKLWVTHLKDNGFPVKAEDLDSLAPIKKRHGVPDALASCHTAAGRRLRGRGARARRPDRPAAPRAAQGRRHRRARHADRLPGDGGPRPTRRAATRS